MKIKDKISLHNPNYTYYLLYNKAVKISSEKNKNSFKIV